MRKCFMLLPLVVAFIGLAPIPAAWAEGPRPPAPPVTMRLDMVGENYIVAEERKFLLSRTVEVKNERGAVIWPSLLPLRKKVEIKYHFDGKNQPVADSIVVVGGR